MNTIDEFKSDKLLLEDHIFSMLQKFEGKYKCHVENIDTDKVIFSGINGVKDIRTVKVKIKVDL